MKRRIPPARSSTWPAAGNSMYIWLGGAPLMTDPLREQIARFLDFEEAHVGFDRAVKGIAPRYRGIVPNGLPHSAWQLLEHLRIAQADILEFCRSARYKEKKWPDDYWPPSPKPPSACGMDAIDRRVPPRSHRAPAAGAQPEDRSVRGHPARHGTDLPARAAADCRSHGLSRGPARERQAGARDMVNVVDPGNRAATR